MRFYLNIASTAVVEMGNAYLPISPSVVDARPGSFFIVFTEYRRAMILRPPISSRKFFGNFAGLTRSAATQTPQPVKPPVCSTAGHGETGSNREINIAGNSLKICCRDQPADCKRGQNPWLLASASVVCW